tara:strand:+ start:84 stop:476 length:393 start_codon:yes stop_codon:yes gene_type:complete
MGKHQLFSKIPPKELIIKLLNCFGFKDFEDQRCICKKYFTKLKILDNIQTILPELQKYYLPCKAKTYLSKLTNNSAMTILRQCIRPFEYNIVGKEKYINGEKIINYHIESKIKTQLKPIIENNHVILTFS